MKPSLFLVLAVLAMARGMPAIADDTRIGVTPDEIQWGQVEGLGLAVILQGDPAKSRSYILRIQGTTQQHHATPRASAGGEHYCYLWLVRFRTGHGIRSIEWARPPGRLFRPLTRQHLALRLDRRGRRRDPGEWRWAVPVTTERQVPWPPRRYRAERRPA